MPPRRRARSNSKRGDHRFAVGQDNRKRGDRGYDGGKKVKGRKRHILVDTLGLVIKALVHPPDLSDKAGGILLLTLMAVAKEAFPRMKKVWADSAYRGTKDSAREALGWELEIVKRPARRFWVPEGTEPPEVPSGFLVLPRRWVVERTFAWLGTNRRLSKCYTVSTS